jgi:hypothetical protein
MVRRDQHRNGPADRLTGGVAEQNRGPVVPARDDTIQILADDRIV